MRLLLLVTLILSGCQSAQVRREDMPSGVLKPTSFLLLSVDRLIKQKEYAVALKTLKGAPDNEPTEILWKHYLRGLVHLNRNREKDAHRAFGKTVEAVRKGSKDGTHFRLAALSLKKLGWLARKAGNYSTAYGYHAMEFDYLRKWGSPEEVHDAAISLDMDSYLLKDWELSEVWLKRSLDIAALIQDSVRRTRALAMSHNNLAATLSTLHRFEEAEAAISRSLLEWQVYEDVAGPKEHRVLWAHFGVGDVYQQWAKSLKKAGKDPAVKKGKALAAYAKSLSLAKRRSVDSKTIEARLKEASSL